MFQSLRPNNQIYILNKEKSSFDIGSVVNVSIPMPKYTIPNTFGNQEMTVDILVKVNNQDINYQKIPATLDIADFGNNIVISDSKEAMGSEILSFKQKSIDAINSLDWHKQNINNCDTFMEKLNPDFAMKQAQQKEINDLKIQVNKMTESISDLMKANQDLIKQIKIQNYENVGN